MSIIVIGTMPVDLIATVDDDFLHAHGITKQICTVISKAKQATLQALEDYTAIPGGSAANQAAALAFLGNDINFVAPYGLDDYGQISVKALRDLNITVVDPIKTCQTQTIFTYLTSDGSRSFAAFYDQDVVPDLNTLPPKHHDYMVINGYGFHHKAYATHLLEHHKNGSFSGQNIIFCPNDVSVIHECNDICKAYLNLCHHIVMNDTEAHAITGHTDIDDQIMHLQNLGKSGAITMGANGAYLFTPVTTLHIPSTLNPDDFIDSNGAGDAFSAGYIHGVIRGWSLAKMGLLGSYCAASVLSVHGARAHESIKDSLTKIKS